MIEFLALLAEGIDRFRDCTDLRDVRWAWLTGGSIISPSTGKQVCWVNVETNVGWRAP